MSATDTLKQVDYLVEVDLADAIDTTEGLEELVDVLAQVRTLAQALSMARSQVEERVVKAMGEAKEADAGHHHITRRWSPARAKWDNERAASAVVGAAMAGSIDPEQAILKCAAVSYWRKGAIRDLLAEAGVEGVDPDSWVTYEGGGKWSVQLAPAEATA